MRGTWLALLAAVTRFHLVRHATCDPVGRALAGRAPGIHLNDEGRAQAERLAARMAGVPLAAVYASPLERARETAAPLAARRGFEVRDAAGAIEIDFGDWTGRRLDELAGDPVWRRFNEARVATRIPGGETIAEVQARIGAELDRLAALHPGESIALVSHGDVIRAALCLHLGVPLDLMGRIEIGCASVAVLEVAPWGARLLRLADGGAP